MAVLDPIKPTILSARLIPNVHPDFAAKLEADRPSSAASG
jgi:ethanolamine utilization protein EutL